MNRGVKRFSLCFILTILCLFAFIPPSLALSPNSFLDELRREAEEQGIEAEFRREIGFASQLRLIYEYVLEKGISNYAVAREAGETIEEWRRTYEAVQRSRFERMGLKGEELDREVTQEITKWKDYQRWIKFDYDSIVRINDVCYLLIKMHHRHKILSVFDSEKEFSRPTIRIEVDDKVGRIGFQIIDIANAKDILLNPNNRFTFSSRDEGIAALKKWTKAGKCTDKEIRDIFMLAGLQVEESAEGIGLTREKRFIAISADLPPPENERFSSDIRISTDRRIAAEFKRIREEDKRVVEFVDAFHEAMERYHHYSQMPLEVKRDFADKLLFKGSEREKRYLLSKIFLQLGRRHLSRSTVEDRESYLRSLVVMLAAERAKIGAEEISVRDKFGIPIENRISVRAIYHNELSQGELYEKIKDWNPKLSAKKCQQFVKGIFRMVELIRRKPLFYRNERNIPNMLKINEEYKSFLPEAMIQNPTQFIERKKEIERRARFSETIAGLVDFPYDSSKVKEFTLKSKEGKSIAIVSKRVDPLKVNYPEEEVFEARRIKRLLEDIDIERYQVDVQRFIGIAYSRGNFYLLSLKENACCVDDIPIYYTDDVYSKILKMIENSNILSTPEKFRAFVRKYKLFPRFPPIDEEIEWMRQDYKKEWKWLTAVGGAIKVGVATLQETLGDVIPDLAERNVLWELTEEGEFRYILIDFETNPPLHESESQRFDHTILRQFDASL